MNQRAPRSIRLTETEESLSMRLAEKQGLTFHGWVTSLIRRAINRDPQAKQIYREKTEQERAN